MLPSLRYRGKHGLTRRYEQACDVVPSFLYMAPLNALMMDALENCGAVYGQGFLFVMATGRRPTSMLDLMGNYVASDITDHGTINFVELYGANRVNIAENSYMSLPDAITAIPGLVAESFTLGVYSTTNYVGPYQEIGAQGTGGLKSAGVRTGSGIAAFFFTGADSIIINDSSAWGFAAFTRQSASTVVTQRHSTQKTTATALVSMPAAVLAILSQEPANANSPNQLPIAFAQPGITAAQLNNWYLACTRWARGVGILSDITVAPIVLGDNCFDHTALDAVIPSDFRIARQLNFPATNTTPADDTNAWPITDSFVRAQVVSYLAVETLGADPIDTTNTSATVTINWVDHDLEPGDVVQIAGATTGAGISAAAINKRHEVVSTPDADTLTVLLAETATSSTSIGGAAVTTLPVRIRLPAWATSAFIPPRSGRFWHIAWMNRGERGDGSASDTPSSPYSTTNFKGNDSYGSAIKRITTAGSVIAGQECRPVYTTKRRAGGATLVHAAHMAGLSARDDARLTTFNGVFRAAGWGYLDIAEAWDIDPADVMTCRHAIINADDIFTTAGVSGYAVAYDIVLLSCYNFNDFTAEGWATTRLGVIYDDEAADARTGAFRLNLFTCLNEIYAAVPGLRFASFGHFLAGNAATHNGWYQEIAADVLALSALSYVFLIASATAPGGDSVGYLDEQAETFSGPDGLTPINYAKLGVSFTTGVGKISINDAAPVSPQQMSLVMSDLVGDWIRDHGIPIGHVRRAGRVEGGTSDLFHNQQIMRGFRNLAPTTPPEAPPP